MASVSTTFSDVGLGDPVFVRKGQPVTYSASITDATLHFQRSENGGSNWENVQSATSAIASTTIINEGKDAQFRFACTVFDGDTGAASSIVKNGTAVVSGVGSSPVSTARVYEYGDIAKRTVIECNGLAVTISDDAGVAQYGGVKIYGFPEGLILTKGAQVSGIFTAGVTGTIIDNWDGDVSLGTDTATTGSTLTGTEANIMQSVAVSAGASDKLGVVDAVSVATALTESGARWLDGTTTPIDMYLNFLIDDNVSHTSGTASFTGTVVFHWEHLGDN